MRLILLMLTAVGLSRSASDGFAVRNLTALKFDAAAAFGADYVARVDSARITIICSTCKSAPVIDLLLGRQADGTEERVRSGITTIARLDSLCRARNTSCRIEGLGVAPAVGWISSYRLGDRRDNTAIVLRGGDLLTIRSSSLDSVTSRRYTDRLLATVVPTIVGQ